MFIAFPERLGKYGALDYMRDRLSICMDLESRQMVQDSHGYSILRVDTRDVPKAVEAGALFGITGLDWLTDFRLGGYGKGLSIVKELDFGGAEICAFKGPGKVRKPARIATPYENISKDYLKSNFPDFCDLYGNRGEVQVIRGKTEGWIKSGLADIVIDNRNSGRTQKENGLIEYDKIMDSYAIVISTKGNKYRVKKVLGV
jgi:ATP phosphoribosyltransferase